MPKRPNSCISYRVSCIYEAICCLYSGGRVIGPRRFCVIPASSAASFVRWRYARHFSHRFANRILTTIITIKMCFFRARYDRSVSRIVTIVKKRKKMATHFRMHVTSIRTFKDSSFTVFRRRFPEGKGDLIFRKVREREREKARRKRRGLSDYGRPLI